MTELLYIDNQLCDLPASGLGINLNYTSSILTSTTAQTGGYSNTIKLPRTERNAAIFGATGQVSVVSNVPYTYHTARYIRDGVEIIKSGKCYLLAVSKEYECTIVWGTKTLADIFGDDTLDELAPTSTKITTIATENPIGTLIDSTADIINVWYDSAEGGGVTLPPIDGVSVMPYQPSARVDYIINGGQGDAHGICAKYSLVLNHNEDFSHYAIPLVTRHGGYNEPITGNIYIKINSDEAIGRKLDISQYNGDLLIYTRRATQADDGTNNGVVVLWDMTLHITGTIDFRIYDRDNASYVTYQSTPSKLSLWVVDVDRTRRILLADKTKITLPYPNDNYSMRMTFDELVDVKKGDVVCFAFAGMANTYNAVINTGTREINVENEPPLDVAPFGVNIARWQNLPKVKITDFFRTLNAITGTYSIVKDNEVTFVRYSDLKTNAVDWSDYLLRESEIQEAQSIGYKLGDWAQNNYFEWAEDEDNTYRGNIVVPNLQLENERDFIKSPFRLIEDGYIPHYESEQDDSGNVEYKFNEIDPYLFVLDAYILTAGANFGQWAYKASNVDSQHSNINLSFASIVANKYADLQSWLQNAAVVKVSLDLSDVELSTLDLSHAVYFSQFGKYFIPLKITSNSNGKTTAELLRI